MKLFLTPGACSLSPHIVLREADLPFEAEVVDLKTKRTKSGADFRALNPKGQVPTLQLDGGDILTEGAAIVQYLADQKPEKKLAPANGTVERYHLQEWLNYVAAEVHKGFSPLFNPNTPDAYKGIAKQNLAAKFEHLAKTLGSRDYLMGSFTVADAYLYTILTWAKPMGIDIGQWPTLKAYFDRIAARPAVRAAHEAEAKAKQA